jgi:hypothetical protein
MQKILLFVFVLVWLPLAAQEVSVEYDKSKDRSGYKTFMFGESEIVTSKSSKKISDAALNKIIIETIEKELNIKGLTRQETGAQLIVTYVAGSFNHTEFENLGPLGQSPGQIGQSWSREYTQGSLIIDLNDSKNGDLIWRVNSTTTTNGPEARQNVEQVVSKGFRKFGETPKKKKK